MTCKIEEIKTELSNGDVISALPALRELVAREPHNQEAKVLYGTCCHICGDDETFVQIDDELAKDRDFCHKRVYRKYHAMRVAACGAIAVALTSVMMPQAVGAETSYVLGSKTLYGGGYYYECESDTIRIYFYGGGGSGSMATVTRNVDACSYSYYVLPACRFTRPGYSFVGWAVDNVCTLADVFQPGDELELTPGCGDFYLTAQWRQSAQQYSLTVNPNGGYLSGGNFGSDNGYSWSTSVTVTRGSTAYHSLGRATRSGYTFTGWWTSPSGGTRVVDSNGNCIVGSYWNSAKQWIYQGNVTLYAQWRQNAQQYVITVDPNGGYLSGGNFGSDNGYSWPTSVTVTRGKSAYYSLGRATRSGYTFTGWWTSPSGGTRVFDSNGNCIVGSYWNSSKQWIYQGNVTLYAQWMAQAPTSAYTLILQPNGGSLRGGNFGSANETTGSASVRVSYGRSAYSSLGRATRHNYTFTGWWTSPSGGTRVFDSNGNCIVGNYWNSSKQWIYRGNITLYAQWQACSYQRTSTSGSGLWTRLSDGSWCSGSIGDMQSTSIARTVSGARTVTFKWRTSSEENFDNLMFYIDGVEMTSVSGETSWKTESFNVVGNGMHTIRWTYSKDGSVSNGSDCGWIDDIRW